MRDRIFVSYSHKDKKWLAALQNMLKPVQRSGDFIIWDDTRIEAGDEWRAEIDRALASAKIAVLLVSPDFLASDFILNHELPPLLDAARSDGLRILWIAVRPSFYAKSQIERYQALNDPLKPLSSLAGARREQALVKICERIEQIYSDQVPGLPPGTPAKSLLKLNGVYRAYHFDFDHSMQFYADVYFYLRFFGDGTVLEYVGSFRQLESDSSTIESKPPDEEAAQNLSPANQKASSGKILLKGTQLTFSLRSPGKPKSFAEFRGSVDGEKIDGEMKYLDNGQILPLNFWFTEMDFP